MGDLMDVKITYNEKIMKQFVNCFLSSSCLCKGVYWYIYVHILHRYILPSPPNTNLDSKKDSYYQTLYDVT